MRQIIVNLLIMLFASLVFAYAFFGWFTGCGEHYIDAYGVLHSHECFKLTDSRGSK